MLRLFPPSQRFPVLGFELRTGAETWWEHLTFAAKLEIGVRSQESGARRKEEEGRRKEPEEVFLQI
jgi:hypothetical protein